MKLLNKEIHMAGPWMTNEEKRIVVDALENGWYGSNAYNYCEMFEKNLPISQSKIFINDP